MNRINKLILILTISGIITLGIGCSYIPQTGGTVPPDKTLEEFNKQQQEAVYGSVGFKVTMVGAGITMTGLIILSIRAYIADLDNSPRITKIREIKPILKVRRAAILPGEVIETLPHVNAQTQEAIKITVDDPKPQVQTTPNFGATTAPPISSSPPAQLVPSNHVGPVIQYVSWPGPMNGRLSRTFKYPSPYEAFNR